MVGNKVKEFFYPGNAVTGEPDYRFAEFFVHRAANFAEMAIGSLLAEATSKKLRLIIKIPIRICLQVASEIILLWHQKPVSPMKSALLLHSYIIYYFNIKLIQVYEKNHLLFSICSQSYSE